MRLKYWKKNIDRRIRVPETISNKTSSMDIQIQAIQFDADAKLVALIEKKITKLNTFFDHIIDAEVFLKLENKSTQVKDKTITIRLNIPGKTLAAEETSKLFEEATDLAVESLRRQLKKHKEKNRN